MKVTEGLLTEHRLLKILATQLESAAESKGELPMLVGAASMLQKALIDHSRVEDDGLFARLEAAMGGGGGPVAVMRADHEQIEGMLGEIADGTNRDQVARTVREVVGLTRDHFDKEENILFPMAEQVLDEKVLEDLSAPWKV